MLTFNSDLGEGQKLLILSAYDATEGGALAAVREFFQDQLDLRWTDYYAERASATVLPASHGFIAVISAVLTPRAEFCALKELRALYRLEQAAREVCRGERLTAAFEQTLEELDALPRERRPLAALLEEAQDEEH